MPYDPTQDALYRPQLGKTVFQPGVSKPPQHMCAELARLAYVQFEDSAAGLAALTAALRAGGLGKPAPFSTPGTSTEGFLVTANDGGDAFVVFRGTESRDPTDLGSDAEFRLKAWKGGGRVHTGFLKALDSVWDKVAAELAACTATRLWFTGHSLGAALATLAMQRAGRPNSHLVTFGSPRVGDAAFVALFSGLPVERHVNCCDVVTQVPPTILGYEHIPAFEYIDQAGVLHSPPPTGKRIDADRWSAWADYALHYAWKFGNVGARNLADHAPANYIRVFYP